MSEPNMKDVSVGKEGVPQANTVDDFRHYLDASSKDGVTETHRGAILRAADPEEDRALTEE